jgi:group I intron endonuclease
MIHYVYETKNIINDKIYVGVRSSSHIDDGYFGSGKLLKKAFEKYGINNFQKRILWVFGTSEEAYLKEKEIVDDIFVLRKDTYNIAIGGKGGYLGDDVNEKRKKSLMGHVISEETKNKISKKAKGRIPNRKKRKWTLEQRSKLSESCKGRIPWNKDKSFSEDQKINMRKPHKSTGPKIRLSCIRCKSQTTVNAFWRHKDCK